jgi:hypothetical protein
MATVKKTVKKAQDGKEVGDYFWKDPKYKFSNAKKPMTGVVRSNDGNYRKKTTYLGDDNVDKRLIKERRTVKGFLTGAPKAGGKMETIEPMKKGGKVGKAKAGKQMIKRADGSTSQRGLWDNLRNKAAKNKASGAKPKAPSKAMLSQEKKIKAKGKKY